MRPLKRLAAGTTAILVAAVSILTITGADGRDLLWRAVLVPGIDVPRRTQVRLLTPDPLIIGKGETLELRARAGGVIPSDGTAILQYDGEPEPVQIRLNADPQHPGDFVAVVSAVTHSFTYRVYLNDGHAADARVRAATRPAIVSLEIEQHFPGYTCRPPIRRSADDLQLLVGSKLSFRAAANSSLHAPTHDPKANSRVIFHCRSGNLERTLISTGEHPRELTSLQPLAVPSDAQGLSLVAVDADGLSSADPVVYPITIVPDQPPTVAITYPSNKEQLSTASAQLIVGVAAQDDFALGSVRWCYRVIESADSNSGEQTAIDRGVPPSGTIAFDLPGTPSRLCGRFPFDIASLKPAPVIGDSIEWWLEAEDTNNVSGPGKAASDHYMTRIASEADVRAQLFAELADEMDHLKQTAETQKKDNAVLGAVIQQAAQP